MPIIGYNPDGTVKLGGCPQADRRKRLHDSIQKGRPMRQGRGEHLIRHKDTGLMEGRRRVVVSEA